LFARSFLSLQPNIGLYPGFKDVSNNHIK
jgi:hypothetical protein